MLNAHPSIAAAVGKLWQNHLVYRPADSVIDDLLCWYLWTEDRLGPSAALDALNRYLASKAIRTTLCVWVFGIEPKAIYQFGDVALVPCREMPDSRERDESLALVRNLQSPAAYAAFTATVEIPRIGSSAEFVGKIGKKDKEEAD